MLTIVLAVLPAALAACGGTPARPAALTATRQIHVSPVGPDGSPVRGFRTTVTAGHAGCEPGSEAIGQAYRCFAGHFLYDPCWAEKASKPTVLCLAYPWSVTDVRLTLSSPLSAITPEGTVSLPWGVELAGGQRCVLVQGAHSTFDGKVIDYYCNGRLSLLRGLIRTSPVWRAASVVGPSTHQAAGPVRDITIAWFGRPDSYR